MNKSRKHLNFIRGPMRDKDVTDLAGIGPILGGKLIKMGYNKVHQVLSKFLTLDKKEDKFKEWLQAICGANAEQQQDCYECISEWCDLYV